MCFMQGYRYKVREIGRVSQSRGGSPLGVYKTALGIKSKQGHVLSEQSSTGEGDEVPLHSGLLLQGFLFCRKEKLVLPCLKFPAEGS